LQRGDAAPDPFVHLWRAAAEGQRYKWLLQNNGIEDEKRDARNQALEAVKKVIELSPDPKSSPRVLLRNMLDPAREGAVPSDDDLETFKEDEEFRKAIIPES
jgi:hypothetical protein